MGSSSTSSSGSPSRATASDARTAAPGEPRHHDVPLLAEVDGLDAALDLVGREAEHPGEEAQVLGDGEVVVDAGRLGDVADPVAEHPTAGGSPSTVTVPLSTIWTPTIARISVILPQPDGPSSPVTFPGTVLNETPPRTRPRTTVSPSTSTTSFFIMR